MCQMLEHALLILGRVEMFAASQKAHRPCTLVGVIRAPLGDAEEAKVQPFLPTGGRLPK